MGLFSKKKSVPSIDTGALLRIQADNEAKQKAIIGGLRPSLNPLSKDFETKRNVLGEGITTGTEANIGNYGRELDAVGASDTAARQAANVGFREQSFRDIPEIQRSIRESLGGSGTIGNAAALSALSRPVLEANRSARDFESQNTVAGLNATTARKEKFADTGFGARGDAMASKLGLDTDTINYLTSIGREDLIREAEGLLGVEEQSGANKLGIEQARQANEIAKAQAANAKRGGILSSLGSLAGTGIGFLAGGPVGAGIGSQLGGIAGNFAGGGTGGGTFDPTLLYALSQRNRGAVSRSLSGGRSTPVAGSANYSPY